MKMRLLFLLMICMSYVSQLNAQCIDIKNFTVCSGQSQLLAVTSSLPNSVFQWSLNDAVLPGQTTPNLEVRKTTTSHLVENYKCEVKKDGKIYETHYFTVTVNPYTPITVEAGHLCEGELAEFRLTTGVPFQQVEWTINKSFTSHNDTVYYLCGTKPLDVSVNMINQYGCPTSFAQSYQVNRDPKGQILKSQLVTPEYFMPNVDCGNTSSEYSVTGLTGNAKVSGWSVIYDGTVIKEVPAGTSGKVIPYDKRFFEWMEIRDETTVRIKWTKTNETYNMIIRAHTSNGECHFETDFSTILISDYCPDADTIIHKPFPAKSNVLIFPSGQNRNDLNYQWGYTINPDSPNATEKNLKGNKFFIEVDTPGLNPDYKYWVETWYSSNSFCRTRTYAAKVTR